MIAALKSRRPHIYFNSHLDSPDDWREALAIEFTDFRFSVGDEVADPETVDVAIVWTLPERGLERFINLRAILSLGAGINQLDPERLPANVPLARLVDGSLTRMMVDYAKLAVYRHHRKFHLFERRSRERRWVYMAPTLTSTTTVGILGLGEMGGQIALALRDEGFNVLGWSRTPKQLALIITDTGYNGLVTMLGRCDIVVNVLPLTEETQHILGGELLNRFKDGSCLVNIGRGPHVVDADLIAALEAGKLEAATLDVFTEEPLPEGHPFWNHPQILVTAHAAATSIPKMAVVSIAANIRKAMAGERLTQQVDLNRGY
jgi:glyoxylate/hydroxypyruvate reductase A